MWVWYRVRTAALEALGDELRDLGTPAATTRAGGCG